MGDWDDEDFEVPTLNNSTLKKDWDDEEEEEIVTKVTLSAAQIEANTKKTKDEEIRLANVLKFAILEDETPEEKRARERKQIEDSDAVLAGEMFGGASTGAATSQKAAATIQSGVAGAVLSTKADHTNFGILCAKKLSDSTAFNVAAFYKSLTEKVQKNLSSESCDEILAVFTKVTNVITKVAMIIVTHDFFSAFCFHLMRL